MCLCYTCNMDATTTGGIIAQVSNYPDVLVIGLLLIAFVIYGFMRGVKALSELALAIPIAAFVYTIFPYKLGWGEPALFAIITVVSAWVLNRDTSGLSDNREIFKILLASSGATALVVVISAGIIDFSTLYTFGPKVTSILASATYKFYITAVSLVAIALSRKV